MLKGIDDTTDALDPLHAVDETEPKIMLHALTSWSGPQTMHIAVTIETCCD